MNKSGIFPVFLVEPKTLKTILYGFSTLSGPALAIGITSFWCLVPYHNVLEEPCYWYESHIAALVLYMPLMTWTVHPLITKYWSNLSMNRSNILYLYLLFVACGTRITATAIYYYNLTDFAQPMPLGGYITLTIAYFATVIAILLR